MIEDVKGKFRIWTCDRGKCGGEQKTGFGVKSWTCPECGAEYKTGKKKNNDDLENN